MISSQEIQKFLDQNLLRVEKPGRYVGGEHNQVIKNWSSTAVRTALVFPDIYDIGLPNLGLSILYQILNNQPDVLAERGYAPWIDMEKLMRENSIPLFSLESKQPLKDFDLIGFSLPYETLYTNALNILDLSQIPLKTHNRQDHHPLILAGGHAMFNPEPMSDFFDAFVIGEGEEVILEIIQVLRAIERSKRGKLEILHSLSKIDGIYVPSFYEPIYFDSGLFSHFNRTPSDIPQTIQKRMLPKLPPPPTKFIVPNIDIVHNRIAVEIMRGCTRGCRFCHAGMITRPVRERPVEEIVRGIDEALISTGFEEVALLSLSSSDYSRIDDLVCQLSKKYQHQNLTISLPSLRIDTVSVDLIEKLKKQRAGGFTLAPEAATDRMQNTINKPISSESLLETAGHIYSLGWTNIKLYFMIGHPSETLEDVQAIADLCKAVISVGRKQLGRRANLHAGISTFIPKPHTPFQWVSSDSQDNIKAKQLLLRKNLSGPGLKMTWTDPRETLLEAWLSRGDRRLGQVILRAWELGAKFDGWQDQFKYDTWVSAFQDTGVPSEFYSNRKRDLDEVFPWDHINIGVSKPFLAKEYAKSLEGLLTEDCRVQCLVCGIIPEFSELRKKNPGDNWKCPEIKQSGKDCEPMGLK